MKWLLIPRVSSAHRTLKLGFMVLMLIKQIKQAWSVHVAYALENSHHPLPLNDTDFEGVSAWLGTKEMKVVVSGTVIGGIRHNCGH